MGTMQPVTVDSFEALGAQLLQWCNVWVKSNRSLLPTNTTVIDINDWVGYALVGCIHVYNKFVDKNFPLTIDKKIYGLFKFAAIQEVRNRIQDLLTKKRNINVTFNFTDLSRVDETEEFVINKLSLSYKLDPEKVCLISEYVELVEGKKMTKNEYFGKKEDDDED